MRKNLIKISWHILYINSTLIDYMPIRIFLFYVFIYLFLCGAEDWSQGLTHARQMLFHWVIAPDPRIISLNKHSLMLTIIQ